MNRKSSPGKRPAGGSKEQPTPSKAAEAHRLPSLASLRAEIDRLDQELVHLLNRRAEISVRIGQVKNDQGLEVWSAAREEEVIKQALAASRGPLPEETL